MNAPRLTFSLHDDSLGYSVSPSRMPLAWLREFAQDVEEFLRGDSREVDPATTEVEATPGSVQLRTAPVVAAPKLLADIALLRASQRLDEVDPRRRAVVERWQQRA